MIIAQSAAVSIGFVLDAYRHNRTAEPFVFRENSSHNLFQKRNQITYKSNWVQFKIGVAEYCVKHKTYTNRSRF